MQGSAGKHPPIIQNLRTYKFHSFANGHIGGMDGTRTRKTSGVTGQRSDQLSYHSIFLLTTGRQYRIRTCDPQLVRLTLFQLS